MFYLNWTGWFLQQSPWRFQMDGNWKVNQENCFPDNSPLFESLSAVSSFSRLNLNQKLCCVSECWEEPWGVLHVVTSEEPRNTNVKELLMLSTALRNQLCFHLQPRILPPPNYRFHQRIVFRSPGTLLTRKVPSITVIPWKFQLELGDFALKKKLSIFYLKKNSIHNEILFPHHIKYKITARKTWKTSKFVIFF